MHKLFNSLIEGLNKDPYLPHFILLIPDRDIILQTNFFKPGIGHILRQQLLWLCDNIQKSLESRKENLKKFYTGAMEPNTPKLVWIKMLKRLLIKNHPFPHYNMVVELRTLFNNLLDKQLSTLSDTFSIDPNIKFAENHFDDFGNLTLIGKHKFWKFINAELRSIDKPPSSSYLQTQHKEKDVSVFPTNHHHDWQWQGQRHCLPNASKQAQPIHQGNHHHEQNCSLHHYLFDRTLTHPKDIWGEVGRRSKQGHFR